MSRYRVEIHARFDLEELWGDKSEPLNLDDLVTGGMTLEQLLIDEYSGRPLDPLTLGMFVVTIADTRAGRSATSTYDGEWSLDEPEQVPDGLLKAWQLAIHPVDDSLTQVLGVMNSADVRSRLDRDMTFRLAEPEGRP